MQAKPWKLPAALPHRVSYRPWQSDLLRHRLAGFPMQHGERSAPARFLRNRRLHCPTAGFNAERGINIFPVRWHGAALLGAALFQKPRQAAHYYPPYSIRIAELRADEFDPGHRRPFSSEPRRVVSGCTAALRIRGKELGQSQVSALRTMTP